MRDPGIFRNQARRVTTIDTVFQNWAFSAINCRAKTFSGVETFATIKTKEGFEKQENNWFNQLIDKPNNEYTFSQLKYLLQYWLDYWGNAYLYTPLQGKTPGEMWVLPSNKVTPIPANDGINLIGSYETVLNNQIVQIDRSRICHFRTLAPSTKLEENLYLGQAIYVKAAKEIINTDNELVAFLKRYFEADAVPPFILSMKGTMTPKERDQFKALWGEQLKQYPIAGVLENDGKVDPLQTGTQSTVNAVVKESIDVTIIKRVGAIFGVAPAKLISEYQNRATADTIEDVFREETIEPLHKYFDEQLTKHLQQFDRTLYIKHVEYKRVNPEEERADKIFRLQNGISTINEIRGEYNLPPAPDGDTLFIPTTIQPLDAINEPEQPPQLPPKEPEEPETKSIEIYDIKARTWDKFDKISAKWQPVIESGYKKYLNAMQKKMTSNTKRINADDIDEIVNIDTKWITQQFAKYMSADMAEHITEVVSEALKEVSMDPSQFESLFDQVKKAALAKSKENIVISTNTIQDGLKTKITEIADTTISEADKWSLIKQTLGDQFVVYKNYADMVVETALTAQLGISQKMVWEDELGYKRKWLSQRDKRVRDSHKGADGQQADEKGYFKVGSDTMQYPGGGSLAEENVRCRCSTIPVK